MKLDTTEAVLEWAMTVTGEVDGMTLDSDPVFNAPDTETAARLALAMRVLAIMERREKTNDGSWVNAEVRSVWPEILAEASAEQGDK